MALTEFLQKNAEAEAKKASEADEESLYWYVVTLKNSAIPLSRFSATDPVTIINAWDGALKHNGTIVWAPGYATRASEIADIAVDDGSLDPVEEEEETLQSTTLAEPKEELHAGMAESARASEPAGAGA